MGSRGVNKVILVGNLGQDPEVRYMPNGNAVANITLATSESWKDKTTGETKEKTEWHRVVFFGKLAEVVGEYARKGTQMYVEGALQTRKWQDQQGVDRYSTEVVVNVGGTMQLLGGRQQGGSQQTAGSGQNQNGWGQPQQPQSGGQQQQQFSGTPQQQQDARNAAAKNMHRTQQQNSGPIGDNPPMDFDDDIPF